MALVLDATPKATTANSYLTRAEADVFLLEQRLHASEWQAASGANKDAALVWATSLLDVAYAWHGSPTTIEQALRWPRVGITDADGQWWSQDTIPKPIKWATAEFAYELLRKNRVKESALGGLGFDRATIGPLSVSINKDMLSMDLIPAYIRQVLDLYGSAEGPAHGGMRELRLDRV